MAHVVKFVFPAPDGSQFAAHGMGHAMIAMLKKAGKKGNSVKFHMDDGSVVDYVLGEHGDNPEGGLEVHVAPGVLEQLNDPNWWCRQEWRHCWCPNNLF